MTWPRRRFVRAGAAAALAGPLRAQARSPARPVRLVVPFPDGTSREVIARLWGERLAKACGQAVVIDNRPGASTIIGTSPYVITARLLNAAGITLTHVPYRDSYIPDLIAARGTPAEMMSSIVEAAEFRATLVGYGLQPVGTPDEFGRFLAEDARARIEAIRTQHISIE